MYINLKKMRRCLNISQAQLAEVMGCQQSNASFIERNSTHTKQCYYKKLVDAYGEAFVKRFEEPDLSNIPTITVASNTPEELLAIIKQQQATIDKLTESLDKITKYLSTITVG